MLYIHTTYSTYAKNLIDIPLNNVSNESKHGNAPVLDLTLSKETNGGFISLTPEVLFSEVQRIVEFDDGVALLSQSFQIGLALLNSDRGASSTLSRDKGSSASNKGGGDSSLHVYWSAVEAIVTRLETSSTKSGKGIASSVSCFFFQRTSAVW